MKTTTLIKRAADKLVRKLEKAGKSEAQVQQALRINFPSLVQV